MGGLARLNSVVIECREPEVLATFYSRLTGWPITGTDPEWYDVSDGGIRLSFQRAPGHRAPAWPDPASSMQYHLDLKVDDLDSAEARVLDLGATKLEHQPKPDVFRVFADPAGHLFCLEM